MFVGGVPRPLKAGRFLEMGKVEGWFSWERDMWRSRELLYMLLVINWLRVIGLITFRVVTVIEKHQVLIQCHQEHVMLL